MLARVESVALMGIEALPIDVEVDISTRHLPSWNTVGLPESAVRESKDRIMAALKNSGYPVGSKHVVINLAPASLKKSGTGFDLPIAVGMLVAGGVIAKESVAGCVFLGELSLDGGIRSVRGVLPAALSLRRHRCKMLITPAGNLKEACVVPGLKAWGALSLPQLVESLRAGQLQNILPSDPCSPAAVAWAGPDFKDVVGQWAAKRALEVAASGGHNISLMGPPGVGKTLLASALPGILPSLTFEESLATTQIYSSVGLIPEGDGLINHPPFRHPHHSISDAGLVGGGTVPQPGEITLAHNGVLFLDELTEFRRNVIELLRQPMESGVVTLARASGSMTFPARFMAVLAFNPCPCGYYGNNVKSCRCSAAEIHRYHQRIHGPVMDRIDLQVALPMVAVDELLAIKHSPCESSDEVRARVIATRRLQLDRTGLLNGAMSRKQVKKFCALDDKARNFLSLALKRHKLSARACDRILKVGRTLADMAGSPTILIEHVAEATQCRIFDHQQS